MSKNKTIPDMHMNTDGKQRIRPDDGLVLVKAESIEALADNISAVAIAARRMDERLNREAITVLIQHSIPFDMGRAKIDAVIDALQNLDKRYLKPRKVKP